MSMIVVVIGSTTDAADIPVLVNNVVIGDGIVKSSIAIFVLDAMAVKLCSVLPVKYTPAISPLSLMLES